MGTDRYHHLTEREDIDLRKVRDIELWTDVLDVYTADVFNAVALVGTSSVAVLNYLVTSGTVGNRSRTPDPKPKPPEGKEPGNGNGATKT